MISSLRSLTSAATPPKANPQPAATLPKADPQPAASSPGTGPQPAASSTAAGAKPVRSSTGAGPQPAYDFDLTIDAMRRTLAGTGSIEVTNTQTDPLNEVYLRLWPNSPHHSSNGGSATLTGITLDGKPATGATVDRTVVKVPLTTPLNTGERAKIGFDLGVTATGVPDRFGVDKSGTVLFGNALPTVAVRDDEGWNLDPYVPFGESFYTLSADWKAKLRAPEDVQVASTGSASSEQVQQGQRLLEVDAPDVRDFFIAAGKDLSVTQDTVDGTKVRVFASTKDAANAGDMLRTATESVKYFNRNIGKYDYPELDVVAASEFFAGGMEYPNAIIVNGSASKAGRDHIIGHENAHQWFYGIVGNNQYDDPWLDESLTEHATQRFLATGAAGAETQAATAKKSAAGQAAIGSGEHRHAGADGGAETPKPASAANISAPTFEQAPGARDFTEAAPFIRNVYRNGPAVLAKLREKVGDDIVDRGMKQYFSDHRHGVATTADFVSAMSTAAGTDLSGWFADHRIEQHEPGADRKLDPNGPPT